MNAAPSRLKQVNAPLGGQRGHAMPSVGASTCAAPSRLKPVNGPLEGQRGHAMPSVGATL
jgi:hypothetical protein